MERELAHALSEGADWKLSQEDSGALDAQLESATAPLAQALRDRCLDTLKEGFDLEAFRTAVGSNPFMLLDAAFQVDDLPDTPSVFAPLPQCNTTLRARLAALALHALLGRETVAYRSENRGALFVNLVAMPGEGRIAEKSTKSMRGHTDAVSFPFPGTQDREDPRIAPAPDFVTLIGLRNPDFIPTHVIPLDRVLSRLSPEDIAELLEPQFNIECQNTFAAGTESVLGEPHIALDAAVLRQARHHYWVRFSHSKVQPDEGDAPAKQARDRFAEACEQEQIPLQVAPGSLLLINNRRALHGRSEVPKGIGGKTRWLVRAYALSQEVIQTTHRYPDSPYQLYP